MQSAYTSNPARFAVRATVPIGALLCICSLNLTSCGDPGPTQTAEPTAPTITVKINSPSKDAHLADFITVTGTLSGSSGQKTRLVIKGKDSCQLAEENPLNTLAQTKDLDELTTVANRYMVKFSDIVGEQDAVRAALAKKLKTLKDSCEASGTSFSIPFASQQLDAKGKPLFKDGKLSVSVLATGAADARGTASVGVVVDNALPGLEILEPKDGSAHIRRVVVKGQIKEKNLDDVGLWVVGAFSGEPVKRLHKCNSKAPPDSPVNCKKCTELNKPLDGVCVDKGGSFSFELDRGNLPSADVTLTLIGRDKTKRENKVEARIKMLRPPFYDVAFVREEKIADKLTDYMLFDTDDDGVLDIILCADNGVFLRRAKLVKDADPPRGTGEWHPAESLSPLKCASLLRVDLDPHDCSGDAEALKSDLDDILALGTDAAGKAQLEVFLTRAKQRPKLAQSIPLAGTPKAMASGQLNNSGPDDIVIGSTEDHLALRTLLADDAAKCPSKEQPKRLCRDVKDLKGMHKATLLKVPLVHKMLGKIEQIAVGDFHRVGGEGHPDVVVGRSVPIVSVCPNTGNGTYLACVDTGTNSGLVGFGDSARLLAYNWSAFRTSDPAGDTSPPDLIVGSKGTGNLRWLVGQPDGTFKFEKLLPNDEKGAAFPSETIIGDSVPPLTIADVGVTAHPLKVKDRCGKQVENSQDPRGMPYVVVANPKTPVFLDIDGSIKWNITTCDHSYVLGNGVTKVIGGDVDNDGIMDLTGLNSDSAPAGITVARGKNPYPDGQSSPTHSGVLRFHAAEVFRVCGKTDGGASTPWEVGRFTIGNTDSDSNPDLVLGSNGTNSTSIGCLTSADPAPAHMFHVYRNTGTDAGLALTALAMEYAPYSAPKVSGATQHGCSVSFGKLTGLELARLNGDSLLDLVFTTDTQYSHGKTPDIAGYFNFGDPDQDIIAGQNASKAEAYKSSNIGENPACYCQEHYEVHNLFSEDSEEDKGLYCKVLNTIDWNDPKKTLDPAEPVVGYGANNKGAPLERASLLYLLNTAQSDDPFGLVTQHSPAKPKLMEPNFAQAGGRSIRDMAIIDIDGDGDHDVATVMDAVNAPGEQCYIAPRVRVFETDTQGGLHAKPIFYAMEGSHFESTVAGHFKEANKFRITRMQQLTGLSFFTPIDADSGLAHPPNYVSYRTVGPDPFRVIAEDYCQETTTYRLNPSDNTSTKKLKSLFVLSRKEHGFCLLRTKAHQVPGSGLTRPYFQKGYCRSIGEGLEGFSVKDVAAVEGEETQCNDVVYAKTSSMGFFYGATDGFFKNDKKADTKSTRSAIEALDVNEDGFLDILALDSGNDTVQALLGDGKGNFVESKVRIAGVKGSSVMRVADFDVDDCKDLVVQGGKGVAVYRNLSCD